LVEKSVFFVFISLLCSVVISLFQYSFNISDISDFLYIANFVLYTGLLYKYYKQTSLKIVHSIFFFAILLFVPTFFGYDGNYESNLTSTSEDLEYLREYHTGFYRVAHIASYFFSFFFLTYLLCFQSDRKVGYLIVALISLLLSIYVGSRAMVFAISISVVLFALRHHKIVAFPIAAGFAAGLFAILDKLLVILQGTIAFQYFSFFQTLSENTSRLSRFIIWNSWYEEIKGFKPIDFLFGKSFSESISANLKNIDMAIWFHNDILSVIFTYGLITVIFYLFFIRDIYKKNKALISGNIIVFSFFFSILLVSIFNGYYYYHTTIITYLFFFLLNVLDNEYCHTRYKGHP